MTHDDLVAHCLTKAGAYLDHPWSEEHTVVKVGGKIFCFLGGATETPGFAAKNSRDGIQEWRSRYPDHIGTGPYLNKELWSRIDLSSAGGPDDDEVRELIDDSYDQIVASLPKSKRP
jgi:predicted DNA-binding protein (MmcQ/YjbR family)